MSSLRQVFLIARRDFSQRARSTTFLVTLLFTIGVVVAGGVLLASEVGSPDPYDIGVVGAEPDGLDASLQAAVGAFEREAVVRRYDSRAAGEDALGSGAADVLLVDGQEVVWQEEPSPQLAAVVASAVGESDRRRVMAELGLNEQDVSRLLSPPSLDSTTLAEPDSDAEAKQVGAYVGNLVLFFSIIMFGQFVLMGVMEEKSSRVVEVVLSRAQPRQLLAGKVIGIGALALVQLTVLGTVALVTLNVTDVADVDVAALGLQVVVTVFLWFLLGYAFFSAAFAALGATISRQEDLQGVAMIPAFLLAPGYIISFIALEEPDAVVARIASLIPPTSPLVMPTRSIAGDVPLGEVALSVGLMMLATYGLIWLGGRIYKGSILRIGAKVRLREAWRAARG
ncbi:MAG: ABC transporter permease [Acidimicrobiia bacterium]|nr:ABC transporter permease [Acidimicrobiia bacterium]